MGIGDSGLDFIAMLQKKGTFKNMKSVMEIGAQEIHVKNADPLKKFLKKIGHKDIEKKAKKATSTKRALGRRLVRPTYLPGRIIYEWLGFEEYEAIDVDGTNKAHIFDLNKNLKTFYNFKKQFDLVTNFGTTEHVFDQVSCFRNMHNLTKKGGLMIHGAPYLGYLWHGLFKYEPLLIERVALANNYKIEGIWYCARQKFIGDFSIENLKKLDKKMNLKYNDEIDLIFAFRKQNNDPFKLAYNAVFADPTSLKGTERKNIDLFKKNKRPVLKRIGHKVLDNIEV